MIATKRAGLVVAMIGLMVSASSKASAGIKIDGIFDFGTRHVFVANEGVASFYTDHQTTFNQTFDPAFDSLINGSLSTAALNTVTTDVSSGVITLGFSRSYSGSAGIFPGLVGATYDIRVSVFFSVDSNEGYYVAGNDAFRFSSNAIQPLDEFFSTGLLINLYGADVNHTYFTTGAGQSESPVGPLNVVMDTPLIPVPAVSLLGGHEYEFLIDLHDTVALGGIGSYESSDNFTISLIPGAEFIDPTLPPPLPQVTPEPSALAGAALAGLAGLVVARRRRKV